MNALVDIDGYDDKGIKIDPNGTEGDVLELHGLLVVLPKKPKRSEILFHDKPKHLQMWARTPMPEELQRIRSMDESAGRDVKSSIPTHATPINANPTQTELPRSAKRTNKKTMIA